MVLHFCDLFGFLFVYYCVYHLGKNEKPAEKFQTEFQWSYINFTWLSSKEYQEAIIASRYIPENNVVGGVKYYDNNLFLALPRFRPGTPITLASVALNTEMKTNPLLEPYPSWAMNVQQSCETLQNVQSMEIDRFGVMWVLDGNRFNNLTLCPPKIVLLDLQNGGRVLQTYVVPNEISLHQGGFLNDIVIDESGGGFAYITDNSLQDPGIIVYSRFANRAWKIRDESMLAEIDAVNFDVDGVITDGPVPVDGIALSPVSDNNRLVFYCALAGFNLYAISSSILKDEWLCNTGLWRNDLVFVGRKQSQSDGLAMDNKGNLYFGLLTTYGVGKWNIGEPFSTAVEVESNRSTFVWPDSFSFDLSGNLYLLTNGINKFVSSTYEIGLTNDIKVRILKLHTGTASYLYT